MLEFFRKYQRFFFIFISAVTIVSFSFFGTFSTFLREEKRKDPVVVHAVDGSPLKLSEILALIRFIASDREDLPQYGIVPNLCNDGVVRFDLLRTGLADLIANSYLDILKSDLGVRLARAKKFRPYVHPEVPYLKAEVVWEQCLPSLKREFTNLCEEKEASLSTFSHLCSLYQQQCQLSPDLLKRILIFQQQRLGIPIDPALQYGDLSLFGFHSLTDWFGNDFLTLVAEFILNAAALAEDKGYQVTLEEAKGDLRVRFKESLEKLQDRSSKQELSYSKHLQELGFNEKTAAEVWRKVLLFRRYFQGISQAAFVDRLPFKDFAGYVKETADIAFYQWPIALRLKNFQDLMEFQYYLSAIAPPSTNPLELPSMFFSSERVEAEHPELVQASFKAKVKEVSLSEIALRASLKEVWEWQLEGKNWDALKASFPFLMQGCTREERFRGLETLSSSQRAQVDSYTRLRLLDLHPEWKEEALVAAIGAEKIFSISKASTSLPHIEKPWRLMPLIQRSILGDEEAKQELLSYSDSGQVLFRIEEVENLETPHILTFEEARNQGILARLVDRSLTASYPAIRAQFPSRFQTSEGTWKPFMEVKTEVAKEKLAELLKAIEGVEERTWTDDLYASCRLLHPTYLAFKHLQDHPRDSHWIANEQTQRIENQFKLQRNELSIQRTTQEEWMKEAFSMMPNEWSPIRVPPHGELSFFYLIDKKPSETLILEQITLGKELIAADAQRYLAEKLLETIYKKHSIVLPRENVQ